MVLVGLRDVARRLATGDPQGAARIEAAIERLEASAHALAELRLVHLALTGSIQFDAQELAEVERVTRDGPAAVRLGLSPETEANDVRSASLAAIERWRTRAEDPLADPLTADAARTLARTCEGLYLELTTPPPT
jgi:HAMP domain-containing protein